MRPGKAQVCPRPMQTSLYLHWPVSGFSRRDISRLGRKMDCEVTAGMLHTGICLSVYLSMQLFTRPLIRLSSRPSLHPLTHLSIFPLVYSSYQSFLRMTGTFSPRKRPVWPTPEHTHTNTLSFLPVGGSVGHVGCLPAHEIAKNVEAIEVGVLTTPVHVASRD